MKTIIVCTDYSEPRQRHPLRGPAGRRTGATTLVLCHSFFLPVPLSETPVALPTKEELFDEHRRRLEAIGRELSDLRHTAIALPAPCPWWTGCRNW
jgi:hypothetical protein